MKKLLILLILFFSYTTYSQTAKEYFNSGLEKGNNGNYYGAIADYNKTIELVPNDADAYYNRGWLKHKLKDYYGAIADYTKAIELDPNYAIGYNNRGSAKKNLKDDYGAIADYKNCSFQSEGVGTFLPKEDAHPSIGEVGTQERVEEVKIEVIFPKNIEKNLLTGMKNTHPYEEVAYQIYILDNVFSQVGSDIVGELKEEIPSEKFLKTLSKREENR